MATSEASITHLSEICVSEFLRYLKLSEGRQSENEWSVDQIGHFNGWAAGLGVFAQGHASVEYRLKHSPEIYQAIVQLIKAVTANMTILLESLELPLDDQSGETSSSPTPSYSSSSSSEASTEILKREHLLTSTRNPRTAAELVTQARTDVQSSIDRLNRLSTEILYAGTEVHYRRADSYILWDTDDTNEVPLNLTAIFAKYAARVVEDEIPKADPVLKQRISYAISRRHNRILYRKHQHEELAENPQKLIDSDISSTVQTEATGNSVSMSPQPVSSNTQFLSSTISDTSLVMMTNSKVSSTSQLLAMPKAPPVERGSYFLCPYCYIMLPYEDSKGTRWSRHVLRDLAPYICIFPQCQTPNELYHDANQWISHMQKEHVQKHWSCICSSHEDMHFTTAVEYKDHLRTSHSVQSDEKTLAALADLNIQSGTVFTTCPFCGLVPDIRTTEAGEEPASDQVDLQTHISHHLDLLSLFSLHQLDKSQNIVNDSIAELPKQDDSMLEKTDPVSTIPFERDRKFVGRNHILNRLDSIFKSHPRAAVYGLGGVGKSQIAIEYSYRLRERKPKQWVFWIYAGNQSRFLQAFKDLALKLDIPGSDGFKSDVPKLVYNWLQNGRNGPWFIILDNIDDPAVLMKPSSTTDVSLIQYIPHVTHGKILITSRDRGLSLNLVGGDDKNLVFVEPMGDNESLELLRTKLPSQASLEDCRALSQAMEHIPLAMTQACAYINQNQPLMTVSKYLDTFSRGDKSQGLLLKYNAADLRRDADVPNAVITTWERTFTLIKEKHSSSADLLSLMCMFSRQSIPDYLIQRDNDDRTFTSAINQLRDFSLIEIDIGEKLFKISRLVQLAIWTWLETEETIQQWKDSSIQSLSRVFPSGDFESWAMCEYLTPHSEVVLNYQPQSKDSQLAWIMILHRTACYLRERGSLTLAKDKIRTASYTKSQFPNTELIRTDSIQQDLGGVLHSLGQWRQAEMLETQVLETRRRSLGQEHPGTLISMVNLSLTYQKQGRLKEAEKLQVQVLKIQKSMLSEECLDTLISTGNLASTYQSQGRFKDAEELQVQVLEVQKRVLGQEHPETLVSAGNLASTYQNQGRFKEAEELQVQVLKIQKILLGQEHPYTLISAGNLASTYQNQGRFKAAEELQAQVLEVQKRVLGQEHPDTLYSTSNLASTYQNQGQFKEAEELQVQVLEVQQRVLSQEHRDTLIGTGNMALTYWNQGLFKEAGELQVQVLETNKRVLGQDHPDTLTSMNNLACTLKYQGGDENALHLMEECAGLREKVLGIDHPHTKDSLKWLEIWRL